MREVQTPYSRLKSRVFPDLRKEFGKDGAMWNSDVFVEDAQCRSMKSSAGEETRDKVDISRCITIRRNIDDKVPYDFICTTLV